MRAPVTPSSPARSENIAQVIFQHAAAISQESDLGAMITLNADLARDLLGAERCSLWLLNDGGNELWTRVAHGISEIRIPAGSGLVGACQQSGETILVNNTQDEPRFLRRIDLASGYVSKSVLCVPLHAEGAVLGVLQVLNKPGGFSSEDAEILRFMSVYSASAIQAERLRAATENARILRRELDVASAVQQRLLPQSGGEGVAGLEFAGICRSAKIVGGDYFDFLPMRDGGFGITVGDVSGKGFPAAVLMASIHTLLRHLLLHTRTELGELIAECNRTVYASSAAERYSTLLCGVFNPSRNLFSYINAGQVPPLILRRGQTSVETLPGGDVPLGLLPDISYCNQKMSFAPGDLLVCVSDGVIEAENKQGEFWDPVSLDNALLRHRSASVNQIAQALIRAADEFSGPDHQFDDMTVVVVRVSE